MDRICWLQLTYGSLGPLEIYRVRSTVAFLHSGKTLRPILAKSQCWCVDGESKFVLRVSQDSYYRIEIPNTCPEETLKVEEFKAVLAKILKYELTTCPFKRGFTIDLPDPPETPVRKRPWKPRQQLSSTFESVVANDRDEQSDLREEEKEESSSSRAEANYQGSSDIDSEAYRHLADDAVESRVDDLSSGDDHDSQSTDDTSLTLKNTTKGSPKEMGDPFKTPTRPKSLSAGRTVTAPPQLSLRTTPPSKIVPNVPTSSRQASDSSSLSSIESFHSFHSPISPLPPSPPYSNPSSPSLNPEDQGGLNISRLRSHKRDTSEMTITSDSGLFWDTKNGAMPEGVYAPSPVHPETPTLISDVASQSEDTWSEAITPSPSAELRQRRAPPPRRQTLSPLPSPANLYSPSCGLSGHHLTTAILQKTCSLLLGPPVQLVALMLNIASKIAKGAYRGAAFGYGESGQRIPCSWDFSDADDDSDQAWEEDDYGVSLKSMNSRNYKERAVGKSWEVD